MKKILKGIAKFFATFFVLAIISVFIFPENGEGTVDVPEWYVNVILVISIATPFVLRRKKADKNIVKRKKRYPIKQRQSQKGTGQKAAETSVASTAAEEKYLPPPTAQKSQNLEQQNKEYLSMRDKEIQRLNDAYDFNSINGINSIPVPCKEVNGNSSTGRVEYYLRGKCFADHWDAGRIELALACLKKAQALMFASDMVWKKEEFMRLVYYLRKAGKNEQADEEEKIINEFFQNQNILRDRMKRELDSAHFLETDLIEIASYGVCCGECAKYRRRIYSISGKDKRFPVLPMMFSPNTFGYSHVCLSLHPFVEGVMEPQFPAKDTKQIIKYSNRPFEDDRTKDEIEKYESWEKQKREQEEKEIWLEQIRKEFFWIQENLPDLCPKSLSGYSRMKNANSATYQKIVAAAKERGKNLL